MRPERDGMLNRWTAWKWRSAAMAFLVVVGLVGIPGAQQLPTGTAPASEPAYRTLVSQYCLSCHNNRLKTADLDLAAISAGSLAEHWEVWEKVARKLRARQMPPAGVRRPDEAAYTTALVGLESALDSLAAAAPDPGRVDTFRRLNRTEYHNAIRDMLALDVDVGSFLSAG